MFVYVCISLSLSIYIYIYIHNHDMSLLCEEVSATTFWWKSCTHGFRSPDVAPFPRYHLCLLVMFLGLTIFDLLTTCVRCYNFCVTTLCYKFVSLRFCTPGILVHARAALLWTFDACQTGLDKRGSSKMPVNRS